MQLSFETQGIHMPKYTSLQCQFSYPPLEVEDFPQIYWAETTDKILKPAQMEDQFRDYMNGTVEDIFSLRSSQF